jgi:hypothetical protein
MAECVIDGIVWTEEIPDSWWTSERGVVAFGAFTEHGDYVSAWVWFPDGSDPSKAPGGAGAFDTAEEAMHAAGLHFTGEDT